MNICSCCNNHIHTICKINVNEDRITLEVSNPNNIGSLDCFQLITNKNISSCGVTAPLPVYLIVNGEEIPLHNKYGLPISSDHLPCRRKYYGYYVNEVCSRAKYVILQNTPYCKCNA